MRVRMSLPISETLVWFISFSVASALGPPQSGYRIGAENSFYGLLKDVSFQNGFTINETLRLTRFKSTGAVQKNSNEASDLRLRKGALVAAFEPCWQASAKQPDCTDILGYESVKSFFPALVDHPSLSNPVAFLSVFNEQMTSQKCGLYCVMQNYPFANYAPECELCFCGRFSDDPSETASKRLSSNQPSSTAICIGGTELVGVGINATISPISPVGPINELVAGTDYDLVVRVWHWNRSGFITVVYDLGNDSVRGNDTAEIHSNGFAIIKKRFRYSAPGQFSLRITADDGFQEAFQILSIKVLPPPGRARIATEPSVVKVGAPVKFFVADSTSASLMWFFHDHSTFSESSALTPTKSYPSPGVYRVDVSVTQSNVSLTGSFDLVVDAPLEGLHVVCEPAVEVRRIVTISAKLDSGSNARFELSSGLKYAESMLSTSGRFKVLYPEAGVYNLTMVATNPVSQLTTRFTLTVVDLDMISVRKLSVATTVLVNESTVMELLFNAGNPDELEFDWRFSDGSQNSGKGLRKVEKKFHQAGDVRVKVIVVGPKGSKKIFHGSVSVQPVCAVVPESGIGLETRFQLQCRGSKDRDFLPGLDIRYAIISNKKHGVFDVIYPSSSGVFYLPEPIGEARSWTVTLPGSCNMKKGCESNCCPTATATIDSKRFPADTAAIIAKMENILRRTVDPDFGHLQSLILTQGVVLANENLRPEDSERLWNILSLIATDVNNGMLDVMKAAIGTKVFDLLQILSRGSSLKPTVGISDVLTFMSRFIVEVAPLSNLPVPKDSIFKMLKQMLDGVPQNATTTNKNVPGPHALLRILSPIVGSFVRVLGETISFAARDVSVDAASISLTRNQNQVTFQGVTVILPPDLTSRLSGSPVVVIFGKCSQNWPRPHTGIFVHSAMLLDTNFTQIELTAVEEPKLRLILPEPIPDFFSHSLQARLISQATKVSAPAYVVMKLLISANETEYPVADSYHLSLIVSGNGSVSSEGHYTVVIMDKNSRILEERKVRHSELLLEGDAVRWTLDSGGYPWKITLVNEGDVWLDLALTLSGISCGNELEINSLEQMCEPDSSGTSFEIRTCLCKSALALTGFAFEVKNFMEVESIVDFRATKRNALVLSLICCIPALYMLALFIVTVTFQETVLTHRIVIGSGQKEAHLLFWMPKTDSKDFIGGTFPLRLQLSGSSGRVDQVFPSYRQNQTHRPDLLVNIHCPENLGTISSIRVSGRLAESSFPFTYATFYDPLTDTVQHFRLLPPKLVEESRGGVVFEVNSVSCNMSKGRIFIIEWMRRMTKDHVWLGCWKTPGHVIHRMETVSVAATMVFCFMGVVAFLEKFFGKYDRARDLIDVFRLGYWEVLTALWTSFFLSPLFTIVLEVLNRCRRLDRRNMTPKPVEEFRSCETGDPRGPHLHFPYRSEPERRPSFLRPADGQNTPSRKNSTLGKSSSLSRSRPTISDPIPRPPSTAIQNNNFAIGRNSLLRRVIQNAQEGLQNNSLRMGKSQETIEPEFTNSEIEKMDSGSQNEQGSSDTLPLNGTKKPCCSVPTTCQRIFCYLLCFTLSCLSACLVLVVGLHFSQTASLRWITSVGFCIAFSSLLLEPLKVTAKTMFTVNSVSVEKFLKERIVRA